MQNLVAAATDSMFIETRSRRAKRARGEVADPNNWRDWANLTAGPAGMIAEEVLADDVAGYLRFRAVCGSWRRCTPSPAAHDGLDRRFHPRRWIMLPEVFAARTSRRDFLNVSTGERIRVSLPTLRHQLVIGPTSEGLLLVCQKGTGVIRLLNPLTKQLATLPHATSLLSSRPYNNSRWKSSTGLRKLAKLQGFSAGLVDGGSTVALHFDDHELELAVARPDDERWSCRARALPFLTAHQDYITAALSFANRFYCFTRNGIKVVDVTDGAGHRTQQLVAVEVGEDFRRRRGEVNLVDNDGELILLRPSERSMMVPPYDVHRVDLDAGEMVPVRGLRGRAVFVCDSGAGRGRSLSVHAGMCSSIRADAIYRCRSGRYDRGDGRPGIDVFLVPVGGWIVHDLIVTPGSIVDYLSRYVSRSGDIVVPAPLRPRAAAAAPRKRMKRKRKANPKVIGNDWVS